MQHASTTTSGSVGASKGPVSKPATKSKSSTDRQLSIYIDGHNDLAGLVDITDTTTRDELFSTIQRNLQDFLEVGDKFDVVRFQRADGETCPRPPDARSIPIKRFDEQDMWKSMMKTMAEHDVGDLKGVVVVKKDVDDRRK